MSDSGMFCGGKKKKKAVQGNRVPGCVWAILDMVLKVGLSEEGIFEQSPEKWGNKVWLHGTHKHT